MSWISSGPKHEDDQADKLQTDQGIKISVQIFCTSTKQINNDEERVLARINPDCPWQERDGLIECREG